MTLEKDKVYKVKHVTYTCPIGWTNIIIFSPIDDIEIPEGFFDTSLSNCIPPIKGIKTHFTVCFDGFVATKYNLTPSVTGIDKRCRILDITNEDYPTIRGAIAKIGHGYKYNRKLNKLIETKNDTEEGTSI